jgi:hypothetical protein
MSGLCNVVQGTASLFLQLAFVAAVAETLLLLIAKAIALNNAPSKRSELQSLNGLGDALEGLAKILAALKDLPAWVAIFLAALALGWTAAAAPHLCP